MRVFASIQSRVPRRSFSFRMRSPAALAKGDGSGVLTGVAQLPRERALAPSIPFSKSRREKGFGLMLQQYPFERQMKSKEQVRTEATELLSYLVLVSGF